LRPFGTSYPEPPRVSTTTERARYIEAFTSLEKRPSMGFMYL
jgi:hypothetical protein